MIGGIKRYSRQTVLPQIGIEGQNALARSTVIIVGCGALGTIQANLLVRAGVGHVKLADRDIPEVSNLQRQLLFDEDDVRRELPKSAAATRRLLAINSLVDVEPHVVDVTPRTVENLLQDVDVVLDGTDNFETRYLINDICVKLGIPWIYGGVLGTFGVTFTILPGKGPCLRCLFPNPPQPGTTPTCDTAGVLNTVPPAIASLQVTEALKILIGCTDLRRDLVQIDLWSGDMSRVKVSVEPSCPCCGDRQYDFLESRKISTADSLRGCNSVQITPAEEMKQPLENLAKQLEGVATVSIEGYLLTIEVDGLKTVVFPDGRAVIQGTNDEAVARSHYARYIGS